MNPEVDPAMVVRAYLWAVLKATDSDVWDETKYGGLVPIVPLGEEPELSQYTGPHIVYVHNHSPNDGARSSGGMTLVILDNNFRRMSKSLNIVKTALDREDETARDINAFSSNYLAPDNPLIGIRFGWVKSVYSEGPTPAETEGGRDSCSLDISYEYYVDYDVVTSV